MSRITPVLLNDTLNVVALAREAALARGQQDQADRLAPVVNGLRTLAAAARDPVETAPRGVSTPPAAGPAPTGALAGEGFGALLAAVQSSPARPEGAAETRYGASPLERSQVAAAMMAGGMSEIEIARQLGVTREEVRLMTSPLSRDPRSQDRGQTQRPSGSGTGWPRRPGLEGSL